MDEDIRNDYKNQIDLKKKNFLDQLNNQSQSERDEKVCVLFLKSLASALDSHTCYFTQPEAKRFVSQLQQSLIGIGVLLSEDVYGLRVMDILDGGPASRAGSLMINDQIIAVDGESIFGCNMLEATEKIRGFKGTPVRLSIIRRNENSTYVELDVEIVREEVILEGNRSSFYALPFEDGVIGYISLKSFYEDGNRSSEADVANAIERLKDQNLRGVVLDLRGNSGGMLPQAIGVSGLFIKRGIVASIGDGRFNSKKLYSCRREPLWGGPLIVLVNKASASASEIVAMALSDYGRALILGDSSTFGKGSYQTWSSLDESQISDKGECKITQGIYHTVGGRSPQLIGVKSDILIPGPLEFSDIGEEYSKYPLENTTIPPVFEENVFGFTIFERLFTNNSSNYQVRDPSLDRVKANLSEQSVRRLQSNQDYLDLIKRYKEKKEEIRTSEDFSMMEGYQLEEAFHVMEDLINSF